MRFEAIGTEWHITPVLHLGVQQLVAEKITQFDALYSRFREDSWVSTVLKNVGVHALPDDAFSLFEYYTKLYHLTKGAVTPLIGSLMEEAGYDKDYSLKPKRMKKLSEWTQVVAYTANTVTIKESGLVFDFGAAGKGYLVDQIAAIVKDAVTDEFTINAGGDIISYGAEVRVGLEDPHDSTKVIGEVTIKDGALCGSAPNRRKWAGFHHIIHPHTKKSTQGIDAIWVRADSCMVADGIATALFFALPVSIAGSFDFEYVIIRDNSIEHSTGFNAIFFTDHV